LILNLKMTNQIFPPGTNIPNHIVIIPDGNRRWAKDHGLPSFEGHRRGFEVAVKLAKACRDFGIHTLTFWAFSTENWQRSREEVSYLMKLYEQMIDRVLKDAQKEKVRIIHLGRKDRLSESLLKKLTKAERETKNNNQYVLNIALDYGGKNEIVRAVNRIMKSKCKIQNSKFQVKSQKLEITEEDIKNNLDTAGQPYPFPDLIIRPSGELRTSGILLWQAAYSELYFLKKYFPDMTVDDLKEAIVDYSKRQRRYGK